THVVSSPVIPPASLLDALPISESIPERPERTAAALVIFAPLRVIRQHGVSLLDLLELLLRTRRIRILVGMMLPRKPTIRLLDLVGARAFADPLYHIVILDGRHTIPSSSSTH